MSSQSINDRITAARLSIAGQGLAKSVCKATTEEVIGPKKKHLDYLLHCTNEPNVSIPQMANCLIERTNNTSWVVVFKALITVHHLMCYGNERFTQYLASSNCTFQLGSFLDKTGVQGYDMSTFIRRYAKYLNEKAMAYRTVAFDFCKVKRGKDDGILRTMNAEKLLKTLPSLQSQLDALLEFDCTANELTNGVINTAFMLLFRDLIRLFACYNDGIINLLEKYFDMNKKMCRDALDIYKKFLIRMDRVAEFLKVAENVGIDKGDIPDLTKAPSSLLDALEQHLATLEGKKGVPGGGATTPTQATAGRQSSVKNGVLALSNTSNAFGTAAASSSGPRHSGVNGSAPEEDHLKKLALEEEQAILELHKERRIKELATQSPFSDQEEAAAMGSGTNPFLASNASGMDNLFGSPPDSREPALAPAGKASDDLLCLTNNPFSNVLPNTGTSQSQTNIGTFWGDQNGLISPTASNTFVPEASFSAVFGSQTSNSQAVGAARPASAATTEGESGMEKGSCDLAIHGLNPFATISSATPSPSVPFEFGGPGTTPILGAPEPQGFGFGDFSSTVSTGIDEHESGGERFTSNPAVSQVEGSTEAKYVFAGESLTAEPLVVQVASRPISPSPGSQAPKPTPASSPAPPSHGIDAFGEFPFKQATHGELPSSLFDVGGACSAVHSFTPLSMAAKASPLATGPVSPSHAAQVTSGSAVDDLNAAIRAALTSTPPVSTGPRISNVSPKIPSDASALGSVASSHVKEAFGFGSPSKRSSDFDAFGDILQPVSSVPLSSATVNQASTHSKVITGDLDASLASLAQNLSINRPAGTLHKSGNMWNSPKNTAKTGGANWTPQIASSTASSWNSPQHTYQPMGNTTGRPADWSGGMMAGHFPQAGGQSFPGGAHLGGIGIPSQPTTGMPGISPVIGMGVGGPSVMHSSLAGATVTKGFQVSGAPVAPLQVQPLVSQIPLQQTSTTAVTTTASAATSAPLDPFGSL